MHFVFFFFFSFYTVNIEFFLMFPSKQEVWVRERPLKYEPFRPACFEDIFARKQKCWNFLQQQGYIMFLEDHLKFSFKYWNYENSSLILACARALWKPIEGQPVDPGSGLWEHLSPQGLKHAHFFFKPPAFLFSKLNIDGELVEELIFHRNLPTKQGP